MGPGVKIDILEQEMTMSATATANGAGAKQQTAEGRDTRGRFAPGNPGGPGNPYARQVAAMRKVMAYFFNEERMRELAFILYEKASRGDLAAMKFIFQYVMGKPPMAVDPDRLDIDEWQKLQEKARPPEEISTVTNGFPVDKMCALAKVVWPCTFETNFRAPFLAGLKAMDERDARLAGKRKGKPPSPNGDNGRGHGVSPIPNVANGPVPEWWDQTMDEVLAESRTKGPDGKRRRGKKRCQRAGRR
jgi:hypothetical protein